MARGRILRVRKKMRDDASIWVSWPKKGSGVPTDLTEDVVRELALPRLTSVETCRVAVLLGVSFGAMFLAMVPMVLDRFGIGQPELWGHASSAMVVYSAVIVTIFLLSTRQVRRQAPEIFNRWLFAGIAIGHVANTGIQLVNVGEPRRRRRPASTSRV